MITRHSRIVTVWIAACLLLLMVLPLFLKNDFHLHILIMVFLNLTLAVSWNMIFQTGQVSLAHVGFMAIGAYTSTLLVTKLNLSFSIALLAAGLTATLFAILFGLLVLRLKGVYFVMVTFIFSEIIRLVLVNSVETFGGASGISAIPNPFFGSWQVDTKVEFYYLFLFVALICIVSATRLLHSRVGRVISGIKNNENLSLALGINIKYYKIMVFAFGSFFAGLSGSLYAHYYTTITPHAFTVFRSFDIIIFNIVGGTSHLLGPILGSSLFTPLPELFRGANEYQVLIYSFCLIISVLFLKDGLLTLLRSIKTVMKPNKIYLPKRGVDEGYEDHV